MAEEKPPSVNRRMSLAVALSSTKRPSVYHAPIGNSMMCMRPEPLENITTPKRTGRLGALEIIKSLDQTTPEQKRAAVNFETVEDGDENLDADRWATLNATSSVNEFRSYQQDIPHPASVLNLVADEQDRDIYTVFDELCNELLCALGDFEASLEEMTIWKDDFLTQTVGVLIRYRA
ncbi:hypothetical protein HDU97_003860 [Phlyctochytrium planicorne]|nr:hypothetical protein HDU97_003860 [Phlyctochytrium planicorne]